MVKSLLHATALFMLASALGFHSAARAQFVPNKQGDQIALVTQDRSVIASLPMIQLYVESGIRHSARSVVFSPDGQFIAAGSYDRTIRIWDVSSGRDLANLPNESMSTSLAFLPSALVLAAAGEDGKIKIWDINNRRPIQTLACSDSQSPSIAVDTQRLQLLCADWKASVIRRWNLINYKELEAIPLAGLGERSTLSVDGSLVSATSAEGAVIFVDTHTSAVEGALPNGWTEPPASFAFAPKSGKLAVLREATGPLSLWSWKKHGTAKESRKLAAEAPHAVAFSPRENQIAYAAESGDIVIMDAVDFTETRRFTSSANRIENAGLSSDFSVLAAHLWYDSRLAFDLHSGSLLRDGVPPITYGNANTFPQNGELFGRRFVVKKEDDRIRLETEDGSPIATLVLLDKLGAWVAIDPDGRFDTNMDLSNVKGVHWVAPSEGIHAIPLEILMRERFQPRLLPRLLAGEKLPEVPALDALNRVQARVTEIKVERDKRRQVSLAADLETVRVTVTVAGDSREISVDGVKRTMSTGAYEVRLFRDDQLVGQFPERNTLPALTQQPSRESERAQWRKEQLIVDVTTKAGRILAPSRTVVFEGIRLPRLAGKKEVEFSAYVFNVDRVKSETIRKRYTYTDGITPRVPRAYIVTIGVNDFEDKSWNLRYAANDARHSGSELKKRLEAVRTADGRNQYEKVLWVPLISDVTDFPGRPQRATSLASKGKIEAVFKTMAGQEVPPDGLADIESAAELRRVGPEDTVIIVISTHGLDELGNFYFLPADIGIEFAPGRVTDRAQKAKLLQRAVSSDELTLWLRGMDALDQVMIIDACHSAASVQSGEFKPGPMGSRGLGQLAYDKGMRILAATQVQQDAVDGTDATKMGLLIYALIEEGLRAGKADNAPTDGRVMLVEWMNYASKRVPAIFQGIRSGTFKGSKGSVEYSSDPKADAAMRASLQQPSLFDYARGRDLLLGAATLRSATGVADGEIKK